MCLLTKRREILFQIYEEVRFCFKFMKKRDFHFKDSLKSEGMKPKMPTMTQKTSYL